MASSDPELKGGFSISHWVKAKPNDTKRELEPFAASPPSHDDGFFYIRYPKPDALFPAKQTEPTIVLQDPSKPSKEVDWTKHTKPCQQVKNAFAAPITNTTNPVVKPKPAGTDDGFQGEGAACGSSVLKVAHKMVSSRSVSQRGFSVAEPSEEEYAAPPPPSYNMAARRGSRSLPASPLHSPPASPGSRRKHRAANRYFTSPFEPSDAVSSRSWLSMALLGYKKDMAESSSTLAEEDADVQHRLYGGSLAASVQSLGPSPGAPAQSASTDEPSLTKPPHAFRPKPTELREINFWSPTSM